MSKLPTLSGKELIKILSRVGFEHKRTTGSHAVLVKEQPQKISIPVPLHSELAKGTLLSIINKADLTREEFLKLLKK